MSNIKIQPALLEIELVQEVLGNNSVTLFTPRQRVQDYHHIYPKQIAICSTIYPSSWPDYCLLRRQVNKAFHGG
jgi:hypothetical protein